MSAYVIYLRIFKLISYKFKNYDSFFTLINHNIRKFMDNEL